MHNITTVSRTGASLDSYGRDLNRLSPDQNGLQRIMNGLVQINRDITQELSTTNSLPIQTTLQAQQERLHGLARTCQTRMVDVEVTALAEEAQELSEGNLPQEVAKMKTKAIAKRLEKLRKKNALSQTNRKFVGFAYQCLAKALKASFTSPKVVNFMPPVVAQPETAHTLFEMAAMILEEDRESYQAMLETLEKKHQESIDRHLEDIQIETTIFEHVRVLLGLADQLAHGLPSVIRATDADVNQFMDDLKGLRF